VKVAPDRASSGTWPRSSLWLYHLEAVLQHVCPSNLKWAMNLDLLMAGVVLAIHLLFILWVIFGWVLTSRKPLWRWLHIACVLYGIFIEISNLSCPLTLAEAVLEERGGLRPYREPFILHSLDALVYPNIPLRFLILVAVAVCAGILAIYFRRYRRRDARGW
jgi:hypothetical protein